MARGTVKSFSEIAQVLLGVIAVDDLRGTWKLIVGDIPNPRGPIPDARLCHSATKRRGEFLLPQTSTKSKCQVVGSKMPDVFEA